MVIISGSIGPLNQAHCGRETPQHRIWYALLDAALEQHPCKIAVSRIDIDSLYTKLTEKYKKDISVVPAKIAYPMLNITSVGATKTNAIRKLLSASGISMDSVLAFGDDYPDLDMLQSCGISVAMANAFSEIKAVCGYETASNDEDGVAVVLEKMLDKQESRIP